MAQIDPFTVRRIRRFVPEFRERTGVLPTVRDFAEQGFTEETVKAAVQQGVIEKYYVTLTNGTIVKGFKIKD